MKPEDPTWNNAILNMEFQVEFIKPTFLLQISYKSCVLTALFIIQNNYTLIKKQQNSACIYAHMGKTYTSQNYLLFETVHMLQTYRSHHHLYRKNL